MSIETFSDTSQTSLPFDISFSGMFPSQPLLLLGKQSAPFVRFPDGEDSVSLCQPSWTPAPLEAEERKWSHLMVSVYTALTLASLCRMEVEVNVWSWTIQGLFKLEENGVFLPMRHTTDSWGVEQKLVGTQYLYSGQELVALRAHWYD